MMRFAQRFSSHATLIRAAALLGFVPGVATAGTYTLAPVSTPHGYGVTLSTMNEAGIFGGTYIGYGNSYFGFIDQGGSFGDLEAPPNTGTQIAQPVPTSIAPDGSVAGYYFLNSPSGTAYNSFGFVWRNGTYKSQFAMTGNISPDALSPGPTVAINKGGSVAFVLDGYSINSGVPPNFSSAVVGPSTSVTSINNKGTIAGWFAEQSLDRTGNEGFEIKSGTVAPILPKGATLASDVFVNDSGALAGVWTDKANQLHGFTKYGAKYTSFDPWVTIGATAFPAFAMHVGAFNNEGYVAGVYDDYFNNMHAFVYHNGAYSVFGSWPYGAYGWATAVGVTSTGAVALNAFDANGNPESFIATCSGTGC